MTIRTDVTEDMSLSPRLLTIAAPSVNITIQDLLDTARFIETKLDNMDDTKLIDAVGKGGGGVTGVAATLLNAQVLFEPRVDKLETGTVTTADSSGKLLQDSAALFINSSVARGDIILNATDGSHATVLQVNSSTELLGLQLAGGSINEYSTSDSYEIFDYVECSISGGDIFAEDSTGGSINPVLNAFGVGVLTIEQDTSPAAVGLQPTTVIEQSSTGGDITMNGAMQAILAASAGLLSGATSTDIRIRDQADTKDRIAAGVDAGGNRLTITLDLT